MTRPKYVSTAEAADYFGIALSTLSKQIHNGEIPANCYVRFGRVYRLNLEALEAFKLSETSEPAHITGEPVQLELDLNDNYGEDE